ncbi:hypothetical protein BN938_2775 [Mucinivorans hirudinis]|uniref:Uncharacterized protein n=1 Tax=Mucinivorans hirudinis TaxID=1433126 RepID=A0A060RB98_9BACT|nr:hypothetical protein BN938_2775 [Mucinivorans hirudinis]
MVICPTIKNITFYKFSIVHYIFAVALGLPRGLTYYESFFASF